MGENQPGWYYEGTGKLRYMDSDGWTDQYKPIEGPRTALTQVTESSEPTRSSTSAKVKKPHRRMPLLVTALCVGLVGVGGAMAKPDVLHIATSWATGQAGQISAFISPPAPTPQAIAGKPKPTAKRKAPLKPVVSKPVAPKPVAPMAVEPEPDTPEPMALERVPKSSPVPAPVSRPAPRPTPTKHVRTAADCLGSIVAISQIRVTATTATLVGTVTNETGLDANLSVSGPVVEAWDTDSEHERLYGDYRSKADPFGEGWAGVLHPGESISYHSLPVTMQTPDRNWDAVRWSAINQFDKDDDQTFCQQRWIDGIHIVR